jgi:hypothetical protein
MTPWLLKDPRTCMPAVKDHALMICPSFKFIMYYIITTFFWDLLPIGLLLIFHYRNFRTTTYTYNVHQSIASEASTYSNSESRSTMSKDEWIRHKKWL